MLTDALGERSKRDNAAAVDRDPSFKNFFDDLRNGRTAVFKAGKRRSGKRDISRPNWPRLRYALLEASAEARISLDAVT